MEMFQMILTLTINLSSPRRKLMNQLDEILLQAKLRGYDSKKLSSLLPIIISLSLTSQNVSAKTIEVKDTTSLDFLYSLILPFMEVLKSRRELIFFLKYLSSSLKKENGSK
jgi:hypothetical protein